MIQLTERNERLYLNGSRLIFRYPEGDCDSIPWPMTTKEHREHLASCLYDAFESGEIDKRTVALPDHTPFNIDDNLA